LNENKEKFINFAELWGRIYKFCENIGGYTTCIIDLEWVGRPWGPPRVPFDFGRILGFY